MIYKTKETAIKHLKHGELFSNKSFGLFRNDRDCVLKALKYGKSFTHYPQEWLSDKELSKAFIQNVQIDDNVHACFSIGSTLLDDTTFILSCLTNHTELFLEWIQSLKVGGPVPTEIPFDCDGVDPFFSPSSNTYFIYLAASQRVRDNKNICLVTVIESPMSIIFMKDELKADPEILSFFVTGLDLLSHQTQDMNIAVRQLGLPHAQWESEMCIDEMEDYVDALKMKRQLEDKLPEKAIQQTVKI
jgi:hypothetical protein